MRNIPNDKINEYNIMETEINAIKYEMKVIIESVSGRDPKGTNRDAYTVNKPNEFRLISIFNPKIKIWNVHKLRESQIYSDISVREEHIRHLEFDKENSILQLFAEE